MQSNLIFEGLDLTILVIGFALFFFQAEDGIRDLTVTGVQTCALPISSLARTTRLPEVVFSIRSTRLVLREFRLLMVLSYMLAVPMREMLMVECSCPVISGPRSAERCRKCFARPDRKSVV